MSRTTAMNRATFYQGLAAGLVVGILSSGSLGAQADSAPRFHLVWKSELIRAELSLAEIALDPVAIGRGAPRSQLWALRVSPPAFLRLGQQGQVVEEVAFSVPRQLNIDSSFRPLAVLARGFALSEYTFDRRGKAVRLLPFNQALDLATGPDDNVPGPRSQRLVELRRARRNGVSRQAGGAGSHLEPFPRSRRGQRDTSGRGLQEADLAPGQHRKRAPIVSTCRRPRTLPGSTTWTSTVRDGCTSRQRIRQSCACSAPRCVP